MAKPKKPKKNPIIRKGKSAARAGAKQAGKSKLARKTRAALGIGKRVQAPREATARDIRRKGITLFKRANSALARFIAIRYSAKAIAKYLDYAGRLRRSKRLRKQVVKIDNTTYRIRNYIIRTSTDGRTPYSCTCPDFSQLSDDDRTWLGSKAGPFNPCKHMMAVRDRDLDGKWVCSGGICTLDPLATTGFNTKAECEASRNVSAIIGGQCNVPYYIEFQYEAWTLDTNTSAGIFTNTISFPITGPLSETYGEVNAETGVIQWFLFGQCEKKFLAETSSSNQELRNFLITVTREDGLPDDCGDQPIYCAGVIAGCTNPSSPNYNPMANYDDGSCGVSGCTDLLANNFNPLATCDDGSCTYDTYGCTDPLATNYDPAATIDDGSCTY